MGISGNFLSHDTTAYPGYQWTGAGYALDLLPVHCRSMDIYTDNKVSFVHCLWLCGKPVQPSNPPSVIE